MGNRTTNLPTAPQPLTRALATSVLSAFLCACGGAEDSAEVEAAQAGIEFVSPLMNDDGSIMPSAPQSVPVDPAARTNQGRYASPRQAEQLERVLGDGLLLVNVECCGAEAVDRATAIAYGMQAAAALPNSTPVVVRATDPRLAAIAADRLSAEGYSRVWVVTQ